jgi:hypothetical protein
MNAPAERPKIPKAVPVPTPVTQPYCKRAVIPPLRSTA